MYCEKCGKPLKNDDRFCSGCGTANPDAPFPYADTFQTVQPGYAAPNIQTSPESQAELGFKSGKQLPQGPELTAKQNKTNTRLIVGIAAAAFLVPTIIFGAVLASMTRADTKITEYDDKINTEYSDDIPDEEYIHNGSDSSTYYFSPDNQIEPQVIWESNDVTVTALKLEHQGAFSQTADLQLQIENNSSRNVQLSSDYTVVNGYMITGSMYSELPAGKKHNTAVCISIDEFNDAGIKNINSLSVLFRMTDSDNYSDIESSESSTITTGNTETDEEAVFDGTSLYNKNNIRINFLGISERPEYLTADILIENTGSTAYNFALRSVSADNCILNNCYSYPWVNPGTRRIEHIYIDPSELSGYDIDSIHEFEFSYDIVKEYNYNTIFNTGVLKAETE